MAPECNQLLHHRGVSQCGHVAQLVLRLGCNLAQHAAHDLATARLGQPRSLQPTQFAAAAAVRASSDRVRGMQLQN